MDRKVSVLSSTLPQRPVHHFLQDPKLVEVASKCFQLKILLGLLLIFSCSFFRSLSTPPPFLWASLFFFSLNPSLSVLFFHSFSCPFYLSWGHGKDAGAYLSCMWAQPDTPQMNPSSGPGEPPQWSEGALAPTLISPNNISWTYIWLKPFSCGKVQEFIQNCSYLPP